MIVCADGEATALAESLARSLGEHEAEAKAQLARIAARLGPERCQRILEQACAVQERGGLLAPNGTRPRTLGGVFFWLARGSVSGDEYTALFPRTERRPAPARPWWDDAQAYQAALRESGTQWGELHKVDLTLVGRPAKAVIRNETVVLTLRGGKPPALPKGVPPPAGDALSYTVLVARKQWDRVEAALWGDPDDALIIKGVPSLDAAMPATIMVHAQSLTTKKLAAQRRAEQQTPSPATEPHP